MSVRVNLLPQSTRDRARVARQRRLTAAGGVALVGLLGAVHLWGNAQIRDAEQRLVAAQAETSALQGATVELAEYRALDVERAKAAASVADALSSEVSVAWILLDLATVMPESAQLESITIDLPRPDPTAEVPHVGTFTITGKSRSDHSPGVEAVIQQLGRIATFRNLYFNSSSLDDEAGDVATFSVDGEFTPWARTGRYADGLPEEESR